MDKKKPAITLSSLDMDRIEALMEKLPGNFPGREALEAELDRADVLEPKDMPANVITMNSTVRFTLLESNKSQTLTLVYPKEADGSPDKVSVFAPVGTALLGLRVGDVFELPSPTGKAVTVKVDAITYQPESAGQLHR
ncbi:MAG TPA: nucleoside diphosphate kinase regulator [Comamonas sp.]|uniref:nucleoside diphosphate kinase regulator n=1 Tax=Comamonas halotolerans TaxID=3041496 RepID=UPI0024E1917D|nr:nucleoside diphosphate kinase regulator [Comamonas sp. NoAH]